MSDSTMTPVDTMTVLLVEDNPDHAELTTINLKRIDKPISLYHVTDGEEALDYLFRRNKFSDVQDSPRPHIILLDLRLPKLDGLDVLKEIKNDDALKDIPVVVLSTSSAEKDVAQSYDLYIDGYLVKPGGFENLQELIGDARDYWLNLAKEL